MKKIITICMLLATVICYGLEIHTPTKKEKEIIAAQTAHGVIRTGGIQTVDQSQFSEVCGTASDQSGICIGSGIHNNGIDDKCLAAAHINGAVFRRSRNSAVHHDQCWEC